MNLNEITFPEIISKAVACQSIVRVKTGVKRTFSIETLHGKVFSANKAGQVPPLIS